MCKTYEASNFKKYYTEFLQSMKNEERYIDPDCVKTVDKTTFYADLTVFLNEREATLKNQYFKYYPPIKCSNYYPPVKNNDNIKLDPNKIAVYKENKKLFILTSDQFGFSATEQIFLKNDKRYPLAKLNNLYNDESISNFIADYVINTRTIGGSFIWPMQDGGSIYNISRGICSYIEDRVDLTLLEIKHFYQCLKEFKEKNNDKDFLLSFNNKFPNDIIFRFPKANDKNKKLTECKLLYEWLSHFETFEKYIDFFMLNPFVIESITGNNTEYCPIDIIKSNIAEMKINPLKEREIDYQQKTIQQIKDAEIIKLMLNNVKLMTIARSLMMESVIRDSKQHAI